MDLSMILSPAVEEETSSARPIKDEAPAAPPQAEPDRKWSADELQCAVAILQDFQQPSDAAVASSDTNTQEQRRSRDESECKQEENEDSRKPAILKLDDEVVQAATVRKNRKKQTGGKTKHKAVLWEDDSMSKLDLLVEADAVIKRRRPQSPSSSTDKPQYQRSGIWSRDEEEYAAALVSYFLQGLLDLPEGTTLRKFLAEKLCCNRRRVSMKLATETLAKQKIPRKVGASVFVAAQPAPSDEEREEVERILDELRYANFNSALSSGQSNARLYEQDGTGDETHPQHRLFRDDDDDDDAYGYRLHQKAMTGRKKKSVAHSGYRPKRGKPTIIRTGFESPEEEEYVTTMFEFFMAGVLDLPEGTKLVSYLCHQLSCAPKQLSMKLAPRRMGERKFPDNVGSITYMRKETEDAFPASPNSDDFSEELFEVESRLSELRVACEEAHKSCPPPIAVPTKRERKTSMASVSSTGTASVSSTPTASPVRYFRRSGPWSRDEEIYAASLIDCFFKGVLDIAEGTTLRAFLASRLCCNPMRISKKLASECIADIRIPKKLGSSTYVLRSEVTAEEQAETEDALRNLQQAYLHSGTIKDDGALVSKRPRSSRGRAPRSRPPVAAVATDSDATESDSDALSIGSSSIYGKSPMKVQKTEKTRSPAQEARRQRLEKEVVAHVRPELVVPALI
ncbi:hypothetical protein BBO99_00006622 [Phytophthora kernoviae]|uniref:Uncharacterized protein n=2 Tax=Phytophthora kernoviae TaxID=325452 RepID=A0A3R7NDQ3_9STRA|nr:hypothetical protein G195_007507 [Phytophthora kernoviae 00238/432]KAG2520371.1 hypothetical protein JM16_006709 [Phytophthora kernoviae]KAG2521368.1 hypothetical protein JM18_006561 [Phytophthora kernoviae]RLN26286.1 hypothetical protein BBI17_006646 [Phytophthora kernoviae]RLN77615.1 hypothetical protein BBO99_00006622 [Phytophthora kernoviae]